MWIKYGLKAQKLLAQGTPWVLTKYTLAPCFTLIEQALLTPISALTWSCGWVPALSSVEKRRP